MHLLNGVPSIVNQYSKYTPDELFDIWDYEYSNIETMSIVMKDLTSGYYLEISELDISVFSDLNILTNNLHLAASQEFQDSRFFNSYYEITGGTIPKSDYAEMVMSVLGGIYTVELRHGYSLPSTPLKFKDDKESFENLLMYVLYHRFNFIMKKQ